MTKSSSCRWIDRCRHARNARHGSRDYVAKSANGENAFPGDVSNRDVLMEVS